MAVRSKQYILIRLIAGFLAVLLLTEETARAASSAAASGSSLPRPASGRLIDFKAMAADPALLPSRLDAVRAERLIAGTNGRLIVLVRFAHANLSAQTNIHKAAEFWAREAGIDLILSEAAWGEAGLGDARGALPAADLKRASDRLLWENLITGHEYLTLVSDLPVRIVGIEDPRLYRRNWEVFRRMTSGRERVSAALARSRAAVDGMKRRDYPKDLLDHESAGERNEDWVRRYRAIRDLAAGSEVRFDAEAEAALEPFRAAEAAERAVNHERLAQEQELALGEARSRCGACADELLDAFEKAGPSVAALHSAVGRLVRASGFDARGSAAELVRYQRYLESVEALDPAALDAALETLEENLYAGLAGSRDARVTRFVDRHTKLLTSAYELRLTPEETRRLNTEALRVRPVSWQAELNDRLIAQGRAEDVLEYGSEFAPRLTAVRNFYRLAALRDRVFVRRSDEVLTGSGKNAALLITGGYHTDRLAELFAKRGYSVAVFTPYVTDETDQAAYERTVLASDPGPAQPSGTRVRLDASAADRSTLLAPLVRTPAGAARLASAIPGLPADPGTLAKKLVEIGTTTSVDFPPRFGARMAKKRKYQGAEKAGAKQRPAAEAKPEERAVPSRRSRRGFLTMAAGVAGALGIYWMTRTEEPAERVSQDRPEAPLGPGFPSASEAAEVGLLSGKGAQVAAGRWARRWLDASGAPPRVRVTRRNAGARGPGPVGLDLRPRIPRHGDDPGICRNVRPGRTGIWPIPGYVPDGGHGREGRAYHRRRGAFCRMARFFLRRRAGRDAASDGIYRALGTGGVL